MRLDTLKARFAVEFINLAEAAQVAGASWEPFQVRMLNNDTRFGLEVKARQIAWSFTAAMDAVVDAKLHPGTPHVFVSINWEEAKEKIRYAKAIVEAMDPPVRPRMVRNSLTEVEFDNGSRLISHPCRPPRGKARTRIYLDEMAHYKEGLDREIYTAALPATTKGDGYMRIGSSPMGAGGLFWEIATESVRKYPGYDGHRYFTPWWSVRALCKDPSAAAFDPKAAAEAGVAGMPTETRVYEWGTPALIEIFENMFLEDFQQEYECAWVDEAVAWIPWDLIKRNQDEDLVHFTASGVDGALAIIPQVQDAIAAGKMEIALVGGIDVGRHKHLTELVAVGKTTTSQRPVRLMVSLDRVEYDDQERVFRELLTRLPFTDCLIDQNGIGGQLAENLQRTGRAQGVTFTNASKELWAVEARVQAERGNTPIPMDRELAYQIHSIKRKVTAAKNLVFDTERNEKHHADKFWAWALAVWATSGATRRTLEAGRSPVGGWRG